MNRLRALALFAVAIGAAASVALVFYAGRRNPSRLLIGLFVIWVLAPYVSVWLADTRSARWNVLTRAVLYLAMLIVALAAPAMYAAVALGPPRPQAAFVFVIVPPLSAAAIAVALGAAALVARRPSPRDGGR